MLYAHMCLFASVYLHVLLLKGIIQICESFGFVNEYILSAGWLHFLLNAPQSNHEYLGVWICEGLD